MTSKQHGALSDTRPWNPFTDPTVIVAAAVLGGYRSPRPGGSAGEAERLMSAPAAGATVNTTPSSRWILTVGFSAVTRTMYLPDRAMLDACKVNRAIREPFAGKLTLGGDKLLTKTPGGVMPRLVSQSRQQDTVRPTFPAYSLSDVTMIPNVWSS